MAEAAGSPRLSGEADAAPRRTLRPRQRDGITAVDGPDGRVLYSREGEAAVRLNASGCAIWDRCDGEHTLYEIADALREQFECDEIELLVDLTAALAQLRGLGVIDPGGEPGQPPLKLVMGVEDTAYFHWQLPILFESLHGQLPADWEIFTVVCNDHQPVSESLLRVADCWGARLLTGANHPENQTMDFATGGDWYAPLNRIEALAAVAPHVTNDDRLLLMDTDNFLYRDIDLAAFPDGNAVCANWLVGQERFFAGSRGRSSPGVVNLERFLESIGCERSFEPGGVTVFLKGETVRNPKFVQDCFRFTQVLYLLGKIGGLADVWVSEMPSFALSLTANGIAYDVVDEGNRRFVIDKREAIEPGAFYHYYSDLADGRVDGAFRHSRWCKQQFSERDFLQADLDGYAADAVSAHERFFFQLAKRARRRLALAAPTASAARR